MMVRNFFLLKICIDFMYFVNLLKIYLYARHIRILTIVMVNFIRVIYTYLIIYIQQ